MFFWISIILSNIFSAVTALSTTGSASKAFRALALDFSNIASAVNRITLVNLVGPRGFESRTTPL